MVKVELRDKLQEIIHNDLIMQQESVAWVKPLSNWLIEQSCQCGTVTDSIVD